ncbi:MAG: DUF6455 family protein [Gemmobacter sp.]
MIGLDRLNRHADLVNRMAEATSTDLVAALDAGALSPPELRAAVLRCTACDCVENCTDWLDSGASGARMPPAFCRNERLFARLKVAAQ